MESCTLISLDCGCDDANGLKQSDLCTTDVRRVRMFEPRSGWPANGEEDGRLLETVCPKHAVPKLGGKLKKAMAKEAVSGAHCQKPPADAR